MSHQTNVASKFVTVTDLNLLERAVRAIQIESLNTHLVLDRERKDARYYGSHIDSNPNNVAVIGYARELNENEKYSNYEIAVRRAEREIDGRPTTVYDLFADVNASDRSMQDKLAKVFEEYQIAVVTDTAETSGAISTEEVFDDDESKDYRVIEIIVNN